MVPIEQDLEVSGKYEVQHDVLDIGLDLKRTRSQLGDSSNAEFEELLQWQRTSPRFPGDNTSIYWGFTELR